MRRTLFDTVTAGLTDVRRPRLVTAATAAAFSLATPALATTWTISGASAGGVSQSVTSLTAGSIAINVDASGFTSGTVTDPAGVRTALWNSVGNFSTLGPSELGFFGFTDSGGSGATYFGFAWFANPFASPETLTFSSSNSSVLGVLTNVPGAGSGSGGPFTPTLDPGTPENNFYYYLYANVGAGSTISISGTVSNQSVKWLDWTGGSWSASPGGGASTGPGGAFALGSATLPSAVPTGGAAAALGGLAVGLLGRRRQRLEGAQAGEHA